jgi:hypothetical protein
MSRIWCHSATRFITTPSYGTHPVEPKRKETSMRKWLVTGFEVVCLFPMGALLAPLMAFGLLSVLGVMTSGEVRSAGLLAPLVALRNLADIMALVFSALAGYVGAWAAVVVGAERLRQGRGRWVVVAFLLMGLGAAGYWETWILQSRSETASTAGWIFWCSLLVPPMAVAVHQLYLLIRRPSPHFRRAASVPDP